MAITLLTLNIERDRHLERVRTALATHLPDVVCLQEVIEADCPSIAAVGGYEVRYAASARIAEGRGAEPGGHWGVALLSRVPVRHHVTAYYADDPRIRVLRVPNDARRVLLTAELAHLGQSYRIATTHFTWSPDGQINDEQTADFSRLKRLLAPYPDYVLCGDFNAPRGRDMFGRFVDELMLTDHLPADVTTTIDPAFHYAGALELVVDTVFATADYRVTEVQVIEGISDHKGVLARIER